MKKETFEEATTLQNNIEVLDGLMKRFTDSEDKYEEESFTPSLHFQRQGKSAFSSARTLGSSDIQIKLDAIAQDCADRMYRTLKKERDKFQKQFDKLND